MLVYCPETSSIVIVEQGYGRFDVVADLAQMKCPCHEKELTKTDWLKLSVNNWYRQISGWNDFFSHPVLVCGVIKQNLQMVKKKQIEEKWKMSLIPLRRSLDNMKVL